MIAVSLRGLISVKENLRGEMRTSVRQPKSKPAMFTPFSFVPARTLLKLRATIMTPKSLENMTAARKYFSGTRNKRMNTASTDNGNKSIVNYRTRMKASTSQNE